MNAEFPIIISNDAMITLNYHLTDDEIYIIKKAEIENLMGVKGLEHS